MDGVFTASQSTVRAHKPMCKGSETDNMPCQEYEVSKTCLLALGTTGNCLQTAVYWPESRLGLYDVARTLRPVSAQTKEPNAIKSELVAQNLLRSPQDKRELLRAQSLVVDPDHSALHRCTTPPLRRISTLQTITVRCSPCSHLRVSPLLQGTGRS